MKCKLEVGKLAKVNDWHYRIYAIAKEKIRRKEIRKEVEEKYYATCVEAEVCPSCGYSDVTIKDMTSYHERMMEDEYLHTEIKCRHCGITTVVYIEGRG